MSKGNNINRAMKNSRGLDRGNPNVEAYEIDADMLAILDSPQGQAIVQSGGALTIGRFEFTPNGIVIPDDTSAQEWFSLKQVLFAFDTSMQWYIGDAIAYGDAKLDMTYADMAEGTRYKWTTLRDYASVSRNVPPSIRIDALSFAHHQAVAYLDSIEEKERLLKKAQDGTDGIAWSVDRLKKEMGITSKRTPTHVKDFRKLQSLNLKTLNNRKAITARRQIAVVREWLTKLENELDNTISQSKK